MSEIVYHTTVILDEVEDYDYKKLSDNYRAIALKNCPLMLGLEEAFFVVSYDTTFVPGWVGGCLTIVPAFFYKINKKNMSCMLPVAPNSSKTAIELDHMNIFQQIQESVVESIQSELDEEVS